MITILSALDSLLSFGGSCASLELEFDALRHQVTVLPAATPWLDSALLHLPAPLGVALPSVAAGSQRHGTGQTSDRGLVAPMSPARGPRAEELALPKSVESFNFILNKAVFILNKAVIP